MTTRFLYVLPLAAALMLPAAAQQTQSSSNPPAASDQQATPAAQAPADQNSQNSSDVQRQPLTYERHEGFWGKINPFARKKYVQRQLSPVRDRVNELDELTAKNSRDIKDVDTRAQQGIRAADEHAGQADQHALQAGQQAQAAQQTADQAGQKLTSVEQVVTNIDQYKPATDVEIRFRPGQAVLTQKAKEALDDLAQNLGDQRGYIIQVQGFSSGRGMAAVQNSQRMAEAAVRYLVINHNIPVYRIYTLGLGNAPVQATNTSSREGVVHHTTGGRVEVSLLKNEGLATLQASSAPASSAAPNPAPNAAPAANGSQAPMPQADQNNGQAPPAGSTQPNQQKPPRQ
ncbi:MAG TPA: OmpA family protein [Terriglobales bacterium]|nr:OmpA family protein [Terriglobales bacterium]